MVCDCVVNVLQETGGQRQPARLVSHRGECAAAQPAATQPSDMARRLTPYVLAARDGDAAAFERLVELTHEIVTAIAVAFLRDADLGADVAQDVFLAAWRGIGNLRRPERFVPWLRQLTRNRAREVLRMRYRRRGHLYLCPRSAEEEDPSTVPDPGPSPVDAIIAAEDRAAKSATLSGLTDAIAALPAASRQVFLLYYGARRSTPELARQLDLSAEAVRQRLSRARAQLRAALGRGGSHRR
jgi:RNA polymerase sigma factor (sigma-70 family)